MVKENIFSSTQSGSCGFALTGIDIVTVGTWEQSSGLLGWFSGLDCVNRTLIFTAGVHSVGLSGVSEIRFWVWG